MHRRDLLKRVTALPLARLRPLRWAAALPVVPTGALYAAPRAGSRLLVVFMRGGYDAASVLVPRGSDFYYESRPNIAIPAPGDNEESAVALDADWALHPALADSLLPLYQHKQAAFVAFAGSEDVSRSHFETQNTIELGQALQGRRDFGSGFLNRLVAQLEGASPGAFTAQVPLILRGTVEVPNIALAGKPSGAIDERQRELIQAMYHGSALEPDVNEAFAVQDAALRAFEAEMQQANAGAISARGVQAQVRRVAQLMQERFDIGFIDVGGWDTHINQGAAQGTLAERLAALGEALAGFAKAMGPAWRDTVVVVLSEFGRTFRENGNRGTDHGHGTVYWVLGGGIDGGRVAGEQVAVRHDTLFQDRDFPVLNDYRSLFAGLFKTMYGLNGEQLQRIFGDVKPDGLGLV